MSDNAATGGGRWKRARSDDADRGAYWRRVSERVQLLVLGNTRSAHTTMKWRRRYWSAVLGCQTVVLGVVGMDGVVVVVVGEERSFALAIKR